MAENKKGFMLYADQQELFSQLTDDYAGKLIKHIFEYVNDNNPNSEDALINMAFTPIKLQLKRDLEKYKSVCERNRINGSKGGRPKEPNKPSGLSGNPKEPKQPDKDKDKDTDNDTVTDNEIYREKDHLRITWTEMNKLIEEFGEVKADDYINQVLNYRKNVKYKSLYLTALKWLRRDTEKKDKQNRRTLSI